MHAMIPLAPVVLSILLATAACGGPVTRPPRASVTDAPDNRPRRGVLHTAPLPAFVRPATLALGISASR
jgi:predicted small lipoprotein YifL